MSDYSCHKHGYDFHEDCAACEAADDWASKERRIAELEAELQALREALMDALECIEGAAEGHGVDFYAYAKEIKALLPEEGT